MSLKEECNCVEGIGSGQISLRGGDCLILMNDIPDKSIDLILCDLPYGSTKNKWDSIIPFDRLWEHYERIIKDNGAIVLFCDGMFTAKLLLSNPKMWRYNLVWDKQKGCDFLNCNVKPLKSHEDIAIFYKKKPTYNKQYWYSAPYKAQISGRKSTNYGDYHKTVSESSDGRRYPLSVLSFPKDNGRTHESHPTQKPVALLEWLIKTYSNEGDLVLDNCCGSGSTGVACMNTNRRFIGMELDDKYLEIAKKRLFICDDINDTVINETREEPK